MSITDDIRRIINMADRGNSRITPGERYAIDRVQAWLDAQQGEPEPPAPEPVEEAPVGEEQAPDEQAEEPVSISQPVDLLDIEEHAADLLEDAGFDTIESVRDASDAQLLEVRGIGPNTLRGIREALEEWQWE